MKNILKKASRWIPSKRKLIQLYTALLFNANFKGFVEGTIYQGSTKQVCIPGLNCYSCPGAVGACPLGSLQGSFSADRSTLYYVGGILLLYCFLFGRMICGWLCPFGLVQELLYKIKTPKMKKNAVTRVLSYFKYVVLAFFVFIVPIVYALRDVPLPSFCKYICPAGTLGGGISLLANEANDSYFSMLGPLFTWKFVLMISFVVGCVFVFRLFCRFVCPLGALYGLFNKISLFGIKVDKPKCTNCNLCVSKCKMDVRIAGDRECISCGECIDVCPTKAISWKGPKILLKQNEINYAKQGDGKNKARLITRSISAVLLIALLAFSFVYYWNDSTGEPIPEGNEVGATCYGTDINVVDGSGILEETINPAKLGKITIINFWGTWCTPCVNELPYFDRIATEYAESIKVVAIHSTMLSETAPEYVGKYYPNSEMIFASDIENAGYYTMLGGRGTYPYTIVLDEDGVITDIFVRSLTYEDLRSAVEKILNN